MEKYQELLSELNSKIWDYSELKFNEFNSSNAIKSLLNDQGFEIKSNLADMETAFSASYGEGSPVIGILGEFDALSGLSQEAGFLTPTPRKGIKNGHGCGHSLLGTAAVGACLLLKDY